MKLGVLFSGGKDSAYALFKALLCEEVACLITLVSENQESYMFHTPGINLTSLQAEAAGLPLLRRTTQGVKEDELRDLKAAIAVAKKDFGIKGIVTGALASVYQAERVQRICSQLDLWCFNPLWQMSQEELLWKLIEHDFRVIITGIFAYPFDETWLAREIDSDTIQALLALEEKYQINPAGEGGEIETAVLDAPFFKKRIHIRSFEKQVKLNSGVMRITEAELVDK